MYVPSIVFRRRMRNVGTNRESPFGFCAFESFLEDDKGVLGGEVRCMAEVLEWKGHLVVLGGIHYDGKGVMDRECPMLVYNVLSEEVVATLAGLRPSNYVHCTVVAL